MADTEVAEEQQLREKLQLFMDQARENEQKMRIDFRPAYSVLNPFFAGKAFGRA